MVRDFKVGKRVILKDTNEIGVILLMQYVSSGINLLYVLLGDGRKVLIRPDKVLTMLW